MSDLWIFGYGSLMWRPGFAFEEASLAAVHGFSRSFCVLSVYHRGTPQWPGLVLGLDRGGATIGMAYRIAPAARRATLDYLREREQVTGVYREMAMKVALLDHSHRYVEAVSYVAERAHPQYAGALSLPTQAAIIRGAHGHGGSNVAYLVNTVGHLRSLGICDRNLERITTLIGHTARPGGGHFTQSAANDRRARRPGHVAVRNVVSPPAMYRADLDRFGFRRRMALPLRQSGPA